MTKCKMFLLVFLVLVINSVYYSQDSSSSFISYDLGADLVSRYIWRGMQIGNEPHIQPYGQLSLNFNEAGNLSIGVWGSYGFSGDYSENDFYLQYGIPTSAGETGILITDYYLPYLGIPITNTRGNWEGAHTIELGLFHKGSEDFPVHFAISNLIHNDSTDMKSLYIELGYEFTLGEVTMDAYAGVCKGPSLLHSIETDNLEVTSIGVSAVKEVKISDSFSVPVGVNLIFSPYFKQTYAVFKVSL